VAKSAIKLALEDAEIETAFRSRLEKKVADQLKRSGIAYDYETLVVPYKVPERDAKYTPDFPCPSGIILEAKGRFGHRGSGGAKERQKLILVKEQHPHLDIRIVFQNARLPIYRGSKTTYAKWATDHGFPFSDKGVVPAAWIEEMKNSKRKAPQ
jgi:Phage endonuclease I